MLAIVLLRVKHGEHVHLEGLLLGLLVGLDISLLEGDNRLEVDIRRFGRLIL